MDKLKYYPLTVIDELEKMNDISMDAELQRYKIMDMCDQDSTVEDLVDYLFGRSFFNEGYDGKFKPLNDRLRDNEELNGIVLPHCRMDQYSLRGARWRSIKTQSLIPGIWRMAKMAYKVDNDFFHEIKNTDNLTIPKDMFKKLPYRCFYIDYGDVKGLSRFKGTWVYVHEMEDGTYSFTLNMVRDDSGNPVFYDFVIFVDFEGRDCISFKIKDLLMSGLVDSQSSEFNCFNRVLTQRRIPRKRPDVVDPRREIIIASLQITQFIALDVDDVSENKETKRTYNPGNTVKNVFTEVRMWDVGVRYGKAIRVARERYHSISREKSGDEQQESKERKPMRPHVRRAHWHTYKTGKGRTDTRIIWIAPVYVCGNGSEIPVTIHKIIPK